MQPRNVGIAVALATIVVDQVSKTWMLHWLAGAAYNVVDLLPMLDLQVAWNTGISYSLLRANGSLGRILLVSTALVAVVALSVWLARARRAVTAVALGLVIGGAIGNAMDRAVHGAVADFIHLHWSGFAPFGVFNVADVAITGGVVLLLFESLLHKEEASTTGAKQTRSAPHIDSANKLP